MAGTIEIVLNEHLSGLLRAKRAEWSKPGTVRCENTGVLEASGLRPDIVVAHDPKFPVAIETELAPASTVEADAKSRVGQKYKPTGGTIYSAIALKLPDKYRKLSGAEIAAAFAVETQFSYCILYGENQAETQRWPEAGFVVGTLDDLAFAISTARASPHLIEEASALLQQGATVLASLLEAGTPSHPGMAEKFANCLKQDANIQSFRMAATIIINAFVFQEKLAGGVGELSSVSSIYEFDSTPGKLEVIAAWQQILEINYWPIFGIASDLLRFIPGEVWKSFIDEALRTADQLVSLNLGGNPDLIGTVFQKLISDRRFLATFYTAPSSAALLSRLVIPQLPRTVEEALPEGVGNLRIADFACGTGSLLSAAYGEVRRVVEQNGYDSAAVHKCLMEEAIVGCDVVPSATHITASQLSSAHPEAQYNHTKILTLPFGVGTGGAVSLGAVDLLEKQGALSTIAISASQAGASGEKIVDPWLTVGGASVHDQDFDFVLMNPPFTRLTGGGGKTKQTTRPLFAAFGTTTTDQEQMSKRAGKLTSDTVYHANAGAGSLFAEIAHRKIKYGGRVGLILQLAAFSGASWEACRKLWGKAYKDIIMLSIARGRPKETAFSADTGTPEAMIVMTRGAPDDRLTSVSLLRRPTSILEGAEVANEILRLRASGVLSRLEDGPLGGTPIYLGDEKVGEAITAPKPESGTWSLFRIKDHSVAQTAFHLTLGKLWLPGMLAADVISLSICQMKKVGKAGPYHLDVSGSTTSGGAPRGPFKIARTRSPQSVSYPILAAHDEKRERTLVIDGDSEGLVRTSPDPIVREKISARLENIWNQRSSIHIATDLQFNSNALVAAVTSREAVGGRAWPSVVLHDKLHTNVISLWLNSTFGILSYWWIANKGQAGRGSVTTSRLESLAILDPTSLASEQLASADVFFDGIKASKLMDVHELAVDPVRAQIDDFIINLLVSGDARVTVRQALQTLRNKLAEEPSICGGRRVGEPDEGSDEEEEFSGVDEAVDA
ncbi:hypothetical protein [Sphingomonas xanthus]|uniref:Site-specific DNA-methyltransferase (adenine-specific) n=1 Tax=Sphingomonas xanthus TaxID=2594473 RepID=A0A516IP52_9SPHN|nr:hypothetical protein [Sphingomonas xanthus]QDP18691.1 hypothetical protein FMM02_01185 [Sphingomonas xanthus]